MTYGSLDYERDSNITVSVSVVNTLPFPSKHSNCPSYECETIIFSEKDLLSIDDVDSKNISQQLVECNSERENFKFSFVISAGVALMLFVVSVSLVINAVRVNKRLERHSAFESTSW